MPHEFISAIHERIEYVLNLLGIIYSKSGSWLSSTCPVHHGDNPTAFGWNCATNRWTCFTHDCHINYENNAAGLVQAVLGVSYEAALGWLVEKVDVEGIVPMPKNIEKPEVIYPEVCLKKLLHSNYYRSRGFSEETCKHFSHGEAQAKTMRNRVVFPIRNNKGFIIGFSGRWLGPQKEVNGKIVCVDKSGRVMAKWRHTSFRKGQILYNFNEAGEHSQDEIIVVESIGNVMRWYDCGFKNVVACLGASLTVGQCSMLISHSKFAILACDGDDAGREGAVKSKKKLEEFVNCEILEPPDGKDWADLTNEEVKQIYDDFKTKNQKRVIQDQRVETENVPRLPS